MIDYPPDRDSVVGYMFEHAPDRLGPLARMALIALHLTTGARPGGPAVRPTGEQLAEMARVIRDPDDRVGFELRKLQGVIEGMARHGVEIRSGEDYAFPILSGTRWPCEHCRAGYDARELEDITERAGVSTGHG